MTKWITLLLILKKYKKKLIIYLRFLEQYIFPIVVIKYLLTSIIVIWQSQGNKQTPQINMFLLIVMVENVLIGNLDLNSFFSLNPHTFKIPHKLSPWNVLFFKLFTYIFFHLNSSLILATVTFLWSITWECHVKIKMNKLIIYSLCGQRS